MADESGPETGSVVWVIRVRGVVGPTGARALSGFTVSNQGSVGTLTGTLAAGTGLAALLLDLQSMGYEIIDVRQADAGPDHQDHGPDQGGVVS